MSSVSSYWRLMRFDKPIGILLLWWPTAWAIWIASGGHFPIKTGLVFLTGTVVMRALGCVVNDICDRDIDAHVKRTKQRPLATGDLTLRGAISCLIILAIIALAIAFTFLNKGAIAIAAVAFLIALCYPLAKRCMPYPQLILGLAFSSSIPIAFWYLSSDLPAISWILFASAVLWPFMYDTQYALVDQDDDKGLSIHSSALSLGKRCFLAIRLCQMVLLILWLIIGLYLGLSAGYYFCLLGVLGFFLYQDSLVLTRMRENYFKAFLSNQWVGCLIFLALIGG